MNIIYFNNEEYSYKEFSIPHQEGNAIFNLSWDVRGGPTETINLMFWGNLYNGDQVGIAETRLFTQLPQQASFNLEVENPNQFMNYAILSRRFGEGTFETAWFGVELVPEPSSFVLLGVSTFVFFVKILLQKI